MAEIGAVNMGEIGALYYFKSNGDTENVKDIVDPVVFIYLFMYVIFTQEHPISAQHCSPWGSISPLADRLEPQQFREKTYEHKKHSSI